MTETVRRTVVSSTSEVVTIKSDDPNLYSPSQVYAVVDGVCSHRSHFRSPAAADHHHDILAKAFASERSRA